MDEPSEDLMSRLKEKISFGESLYGQLNAIPNVDGILKLQRKIKREIVFLKKLQVTKKVKEEQLSCSNLRHLEAMVNCALKPGVIAVCKAFNCDGNKIPIDIISNNGRVWTKVIARNPKSLSALSNGDASFGTRSILDQAEDYLECANQNLCLYQSPQVIFEFMSGIEEGLARKLDEIGITVKGSIIPDSCNHGSDEDLLSEPAEDMLQSIVAVPSSDPMIPKCTQGQLEINTLNLDVTAMMAYVSNMTNGHHNYCFKQPVLTQQAIWESQRPVKPVLENLFEGKALVCCETAWSDFTSIVNTLGGPDEKTRTEELKSKLTIMPDDTAGEDDEARLKLNVRGRVRLRSKMVFNFGHRIKALTVSANEGFIRAAQQQGLSYAAFIHEPRALTEEKQATATVLSDAMS